MPAGRMYRYKPTKKRTRVPKATRAYVRSAIDRDTPDKNYNLSWGGVTEIAYNRTYTANCLTAISPGTGDTQRIGDVVTPRLLELRTAATPGASQADTTHARCRHMVVQMNDQLDAATAGATIAAIVLRNTGNTGTNPVIGIHSPYNIDNKDRYRVLMDRRFEVGPGFASPVWNKTIKGKRMKRVRYVNASTSATGHIFQLIFGSEDVTGSIPHSEGQSNLRYEDQ